jgi:hypothetical protein
MSVNQEAYRVAVAAANAQYAADVAAAELARQATVSNQAVGGFQLGIDDAPYTPPPGNTFSSVVVPAGVARAQAIQAAEQRRQGTIAAAKDLLQSQGELPY